MNRNPLIPFLLIAVLGIGLMFLLSFKGLGDHEELAKGDEEPEAGDIANATPEEIYQQSCVSCHGQNYEGGMGPSFVGIGERQSVEEIKKTIQQGTGGGMPGGLVPQEKLDEMAEWVSQIK